MCATRTDSCQAELSKTLQQINFMKCDGTDMKQNENYGDTFGIEVILPDDDKPAPCCPHGKQQKMRVLKQKYSSPSRCILPKTETENN